jgi:hypothetical protein
MLPFELLIRADGAQGIVGWWCSAAMSLDAAAGAGVPAGGDWLWVGRPGSHQRAAGTRVPARLFDARAGLMSPPLPP